MIISRMKVRHYFGFTRSHGSLKKSVSLILIIKCFFGHVTSFLSGRDICFRQTVAGLLVDLTVRILQSVPATVPVFVLDFDCGGRFPVRGLACAPQNRGGRRFLNGYFSKEHTVTLTNHTQRIEELSHQVRNYADQRNYGEAHCSLDDIEKEVRLVHRHIDHLQNVTDFASRPAGGS